jgi:anaerobic ribonucleoside-triphosphate reductase activating protein
MNYCKIDHMSIVDGEGNRVSLFVSGCRNHCPGCFNEATWDFDYGQPFTPIEENEIIEACKPVYISGLTVLGGEPMEPENQVVLLPFLSRFRDTYPHKTLWMFTGYVLERDLLAGQRKHVPSVTDRILDLVDVLVDGPFVLARRDLTLRFRGSSNQRLLSREEIGKLRSSEASG